MNKKLCLILAVFLLVSCGKKDDGITINFWAFGGNNTMMKWGKERIASFNQTHSDIKATYNQKSWNLIRELLYTNFSMGKGPDVMQVHASYAYEFGGGGHFYPINQFPDFEEVKSWYVPFILESTRYGDNYYNDLTEIQRFIHPKICTKGNFNLNLLREGTSAQIAEATRKMVASVRGWAHIISTADAVLPGTPPENFVAFVNTASEASK